MSTLRKYKEFWTEGKRIVLDDKGEPQVKQTVCCCASPLATRRECANAAGNKTPCRCLCHSKKL